MVSTLFKFKPLKGIIRGDDPVAIIKYFALTTQFSPLTNFGFIKEALDLITFTPKLSNLSTESCGSIFLIRDYGESGLAAWRTRRRYARDSVFSYAVLRASLSI